MLQCWPGQYCIDLQSLCKLMLSLFIQAQIMPALLVVHLHGISFAVSFLLTFFFFFFFHLDLIFR